MFDEKPTRTRATFVAQAKVVKRLTKQAFREGGHDDLDPRLGLIILVTWFLAAGGRWEPATIRSYKAAIQAVLEEVLERMPDDAQYQDALDCLKTGPAPSPRVGGPPRTSARKRKSDTPAELEAVLAELTAATHFAAAIAYGLLLYGHEFGLRPSEWASASIVKGCLVVANAKATNGRANGESRSLGLDRLPEEYTAGLASFLNCLSNTMAKKSWSKVIYPAARGQLRVACKRAAAQVPTLRNRPIAFYTGRHVVAGRAKGTMQRDSVAALLGHATDRTATTNYARARSIKGWGPILAEPDPGQIATVKARFRETRVTAVPTTPKPRA